ncbi:neuropeptide FF receptor 2-like [Orbicella faveolata]|uniref:neuropeptide FF receptor 2-like n=1 Tax=Orbicella faveolata TaxID=48498 RepID=UPI0009E54777|nr:neuropeptide FF receptor 2-like [Orbicella faveolata]
MLLTSNTTNLTAQAQGNSLCVTVDSPAEKISSVCAYSLILMLSFFGNVFIIIIILKHRELRKTVNYFIVNMAVSDLIFALVVFPFQITGLVAASSYWPVRGILGSIFCKLFHFANPVSIQVSAQSLVWIAIDRFVAVVFPIRIGFISTKIRTMAIASSWIFAGLLNSPKLIIWGLVQHGDYAFCSAVRSVFTNHEANSVYEWLQVTFFLLSPLFLTSVLYTTTAIALKRQNKALADSAPNVQRLSLKKRRQAIQMLAVIVALFYICIIPQSSLYFAPYIHWRPSCAFIRLFYFWAFFAYCSSTAVNPIICLSFVESYRRGLKNILCSCCAKWNSMMAKSGQVTLKGRENVRGGNCPQTFNDDIENYEESLDTAL